MGCPETDKATILSRATVQSPLLCAVAATLRVPLTTVAPAQDQLIHPQPLAAVESETTYTAHTPLRLRCAECGHTDVASGCRLAAGVGMDEGGLTEVPSIFDRASLSLEPA